MFRRPEKARHAIRHVRTSQVPPVHYWARVRHGWHETVALRVWTMRHRVRTRPGLAAPRRSIQGNTYDIGARVLEATPSQRPSRPCDLHFGLAPSEWNGYAEHRRIIGVRSPTTYRVRGASGQRALAFGCPTIRGLGLFAAPLVSHRSEQTFGQLVESFRFV